MIFISSFCLRIFILFILIIVLWLSIGHRMPMRGGGTTLSIVSANIFRGGVYDSAYSFQYGWNHLTRPNPDIICLQEATNSSKDDGFLEHSTQLNRIISQRLTMAGYKEVIPDPQIPCSSECLQCFIKTSSVYSATASDIKIDDRCPNPRRYQQIITLTNKETGDTFKLANIHLCGGRRDDRVIRELNIAQITELRQRTIRDLIGEGVVCIVGDTNSNLNYAYDRQDVAAAYDNHARETLGMSKDQFSTWNTATVREMEKHGFKEAFFNSQRGILENSTIYSRVDGIWYQNPLQLIKTENIDLLTPKISDHNALYAQFMIQTSQRQQQEEALRQRQQQEEALRQRQQQEEALRQRQQQEEALRQRQDDDDDDDDDEELWRRIGQQRRKRIWEEEEQERRQQEEKRKRRQQQVPFGQWLYQTWDAQMGDL